MMRRQRIFRRWHRWLAIITALQLLAWTVSGVFFAFVDIDYVRGESRLRPSVAQTFDPSELTFEAKDIRSLRVVPRLPDEWVVELQSELNDAQWLGLAGEPLPPLTRDQALLLGAMQTNLLPDTAVWIDSADLAAEYRGRPLPLWKVYSSSESATVAYLHATSGEVWRSEMRPGAGGIFSGLYILWITMTETRLAPFCSRCFLCWLLLLHLQA